MSEEQAGKSDKRRAWQVPSAYAWSRTHEEWRELWPTIETETSDESAAPEEREFERRLVSLAVAHSPIAVFALDATGRFLAASGSGTHVFAEKPAELVGRRIDELLEDDPEGQHALAEALAGKTATWRGAIDGRHYEASLAPVLGPEGRLLMLAGVASDRTAQHRAELDSCVWQTHLERTAASSMRALAAVVEQREPSLVGHHRRVAALAVAIARELQWPENRIANLKIAALLHDVGRLGCPAAALNRPGALTPTEVEAVKAHSEAGAAMLAEAEFTSPVVSAVRQHHERLDGSGYPDGLRGENVLPAARILAVADVYEAMTSPRPYRDAHSVRDALAELKGERGRLYDADAVAAFERLLARGFVFARAT